MYMNFMPNEDHEQGFNLHKICANGSLDEVLTALINVKTDEVNQYNEDGYAPLHLIALRNAYFTEDLIEALIKQGADVNGRTLIENHTPLHVAMKHAHLPQVENTVIALLEKGADVELRNKELRSAFDYAIARDFIDLAEIVNGSLQKLHEHRKRCSKLITFQLLEALISNRREEIIWCLGKDMEVNCQDENGNTPLLLTIKTVALRKNNFMTEIVMILLKSGADKTIKDKVGRNAADMSLESGYNDIYKILSGTDKNLNKEDDRTTTEEHSSRYHKSSVPPIHQAVLLKDAIARTQRLKSLITEGTNINAVLEKSMLNEPVLAEDGDTAMHIAARFNQYDTVQFLLQAGAKKTISNKAKETPYDVAVKLNHKDVMLLLSGAAIKDTKPSKKQTKTCDIS